MTASSAPVRVLLAGVGAFGREHLDRLAARADVRLVGVADTNPGALERIRFLYDALPYHPDPLRMIDETEADAIVIATPAASHVEICVRALSRGLCVLLEKPVATSAEAASALLASGQKSTAFVLPGHVLRFSKDHQRLVEIVELGPDRRSDLCGFAPLPGRKPRDPLWRRRPCPHDPDPRRRSRAMGDAFGLPLRARPAVRGLWIPVDDNGVRNNGDRSCLPLAHCVDL